MGKRQTRILAKDISQKLPLILNQEANILLTKGVVLHGVILESTSSTLVIKDMLRKKQVISFTSIIEIILDKETAY